MIPKHIIFMSRTRERVTFPVDARLGFTLIELLVVISIILIASSIIFIGGNGGGGVALSSSQRIVGGVVGGARGQAILKNATTRLIIHDDPSELDKYRRFFGIVYDSDSDPDNESWSAATQGTYLPEGIYFDEAASNAKSGASWSGADTKLDYPRVSGQDGTSGAFSYLYYEFKSNGNSANPNAWLVLRSGTMRPNNEGTQVASIEVTEGERNLMAALIIRMAGNTTSVNEPIAIDQGIDPTEIK